MKLAHKLVLGSLLLASLIWVVGFYAISVSRQALTHAIEDNSAVLADKIMDEVDRTVQRSIADWRTYGASLLVQDALQASNEQFAKLPDIEAYMNEQDSQWLSVPKDTVMPFMAGLLTNDLAEGLRRKLNSREQQAGHKVFGEVFVTNKYGANVAQTGKTTDYRQDDEDWWQRAKTDGHYVDDVNFDDSAGIYAIDICVRIDDDNGEFAGIVKTVLNVETVYAVLQSVSAELDPKTNGKALFDLVLLTANGEVIFSSANLHLDPGSDSGSHEGYHHHETASGRKFQSLSREQGNIFCQTTTSQGYRDYKGLGWVLKLEYKTEHILAPVAALRTKILLISVTVTLTGLLLAGGFSLSLSKRITGLKDAAVQIGQGNLDTVVDDKTNDEIGRLAGCFNSMTADLKRYSGELHARTAELEELNKSLDQKVAARTAELAQTNKELRTEIGHRQQAEHALRRSNRDLMDATEKVAQANSELRDFVYVASHDLREPLRKISSFGALLKNSLGTKLGQDDLENLEYMVDGAERMAEMIEGLLMYSRLNSKNRSPETVDLNEIVQQLKVFELAAMLEETEGKIEITQRLPKITGSPTHLRQLLQNLIANGIKYRREGVAPKISVDFKNPEDGAVRIEVRDNGIGIPTEYVEDVFKMFRRLHSRHEYEGTGIGLAVCKRIVDMHGGQMGIDSTEGDGTTVWFSLPATRLVTETPEAVAAR